MEIGAITNEIDVAQLVLYAFWIFFAGLIFYLRMEDRREGYPLESEVTGEPIDPGAIYGPSLKVFKLPDGSTLDTMRPDTRPLALKQTEAFSGSTYVPTGDPMIDGVGAASWVQRRDVVDRTGEGEPRIVPMRLLPDYSVAEQDIDPRGLPVIGCDGKVAATVKDIWLDQGECFIRYLELELPEEKQAAPSPAPVAPAASAEAPPAPAPMGETPMGEAPVGAAPAGGAAPIGGAAPMGGDAPIGGEAPAAPAPTPAPAPAPVVQAPTGALLMPMTMVRLSSRPAQVKTGSIRSDQFADVPRTKSPDQITLLEEEKVVAYFTGGYLYAEPERQEPII